jgi:FAD binding domain
MRRTALALLTPGAPGWNGARQPWQLTVDQQPAAVAFPAEAEDVAAIVSHAREAGLRVAPQATGHNPAPLGSLERSLLVRTSGLTGVSVDPERRRARVGAGVLWQDLMAATGEHGLTALPGSSPDVSVTGYALGGGIGWLARRHGMQANRIAAVELVMPDGELVRADHEHEPELFWGLRGGGGNFGVVTALELDLLELSAVYAGALVWDWRDAGPVLLRWSEWAATAPDLVTTSARILHLPELPDVPEPLRGRRIVMIDGAYLGPPDEAAPVLEPLRRLRPQLDMFDVMPPTGLVRVHGDPVGPTPFVSDHRMLAGLPRDAIETFVQLAGPGSDSPLMMAELRQLGGALARMPERPGALAKLDGEFVLFAGGPPEDGMLDYARRLGDALTPWGSGSAYLNFAERPTDVSTAYEADAFRRLQMLQARIDPYGVMHPNHPIASARSAG